MSTASYNNIRVNEGCAIGTIIAFAGDAGSIPRGWVACDGRLYDGDDYDQLYAILGNFYGGDAPNFRVPKLAGATADIHTNHTNVQPGVNMPQAYKDYIDNTAGAPNSDYIAVNSESSFDLRVEIIPDQADTRLSCVVEDITLNTPFYSGIVAFVPRLLGDHHFGTHSHGGTYKSVNRDPTIYGLQTSGGAPEGTTYSQSNDVKNYPCESNGNNGYGPNNNGTSYTVVTGRSSGIGRITNGNQWGTGIKLHGSGYDLNSFATGHVQGADVGDSWTLPSNFPDTPGFSFPARNLIASGSDCIERSKTINGSLLVGGGGSGPFGYTVCLNSNSDTWQGGGFAHTHPSIQYDIEKGSIQAPNSIFVNNVSLGDVKPINSATEDVATILFESTAGVSANLIYIIRAY